MLFDQAATAIVSQAGQNMSLEQQRHLELVPEKSDGVIFQADNPKRPRTSAWNRYERYKVATTVAEARELGAKTEDLRHDTQHGFANVTPALGQLKWGPKPRQAVGAPGIVAEAPVAGAPVEALPLCKPPVIAGHEEVKVVGGTEVPALGQPKPRQAVGALGIVAGASVEALPLCKPPVLAGNEEVKVVGGTEVVELQERNRALEKQLAAAKAYESRLQSTIAELQRQVKGLQKLQTPAGDSEMAAEALQHGCQPFLRMALRAFDYGMQKYTLSQEQLQRKQSTRTWLEWIAGHVSPELVRDSEPKVLAALLLHTAWCMEWGDGLPWSKFLVKAVRLTHKGNEAGRLMETGFPFQVLRFLQLSAEDCKLLGFLHAKLLMLLPSSERKGVPRV